MVLQICLFTEPSMADVTLKWPGSSVHICVRFEIAWSWKGFGTHCAFMWFFLKVKKGNTYNLFLFEKLSFELINIAQLSHVFKILLTFNYEE